MKHFDPNHIFTCELPSFEAEAVTMGTTIEEGYIAGTASTPTIDQYGHQVLKGAFDQSIKDKGLRGPRGIKLLIGHDWQKMAGGIRKLETIGDKLKIEAQLALKSSYVRDVYEVAKLNDGMNFSVGFRLGEHEWVENSAGDETLVIKSGDLMEVSIVTFPACPDATMDFVKTHETMSELEKALAAEFCRSRSEVHKLVKYLRANKHLLLDGSEPLAATVTPTTHPSDVTEHLKACSDLIANFKAKLATPSTHIRN